ncbi:hypothetical protein RND71_026386 [Anisodus tanguticus]|uniref:Uncharacterized protein n=1 Tax=Anisodus tanguticus TaxID=243964 RepID=A0AAE1RNC1_9SOLA|nr:hypothetical protein RND71_026386 [Anisodus tanguticus]
MKNLKRSDIPQTQHFSLAELHHTLHGTDETFKVVALLVVGGSADVVLGVGAESLVVVESLEGEGGDETSSSSGDSAELMESDVGDEVDDDGELALGDDAFGDWAGAIPLLLLLGAATGDEDGEIFGDDDGDADGDDDGDEDGELLGEVAAETNPARATKRRAKTIT